MARELVQMLWCDPCLGDQQEHVEAVTLLTGTPEAPKVLELCEAHRQWSMEDLDRWAEEYGRVYEQPQANGNGKRKATKVKVTKAQPQITYEINHDGRWQCPHCDETRFSQGHLERHIRQHHPGLPLGVAP